MPMYSCYEMYSRNGGGISHLIYNSINHITAHLRQVIVNCPFCSLKDNRTTQKIGNTQITERIVRNKCTSTLVTLFLMLAEFCLVFFMRIPPRFYRIRSVCTLSETTLPSG